MKLACGIVGLPNVGKSTVFSAMTRATAVAENYPFCTIDPNIGAVELHDERLDFLAKVFSPKRKIPVGVDFVDIAGLIKGASKGEGLGNRFLANIRECAVIAHVVRGFDDADIQHIRENAKTDSPIDPESDILTIDYELAQADLETIQKRKEKIEHSIRALGKDEEKKSRGFLSAAQKILPLLQDGKPSRLAELSNDEKEAVYDLHLLTMKPVIFVCNIDEKSILQGGNNYSKIVEKIAAEQNARSIIVCGKFEADLAQIDSEEERKEFMQSAGLSESALSALIRSAYDLMGLQTFFTAGKDECRAWTIHKGDKAPKAAGVIHSDFEKGFIKAEAYSVDDLKKYGSEDAIKKAGKYRQEGKDYEVLDGDVLFFKFNTAK